MEENDILLKESIENQCFYSFHNSMLNFFAAKKYKVDAQNSDIHYTTGLKLGEKCGFFQYISSITLGGKYQGVIFISSDFSLLSNLAIRDNIEINNRIVKDIIKEIANTLAGNARGKFGKKLEIGLPVSETLQTIAENHKDFKEKMWIWIQYEVMEKHRILVYFNIENEYKDILENIKKELKT
jgi:CheY-specific phosphatase CheX